MVERGSIQLKGRGHFTKESRSIALEARLEQKVCGRREDEQLLLKLVQRGPGIEEKVSYFG